MTFFPRLAAAATVVGLSAGVAIAEPAVLYDSIRNDGSFNESAYRGAERWVEETGGSYFWAEAGSDADLRRSLSRAAQRGYDPIITTGFNWQSAITEVAPDFPDTTFVTIDGYVDPEEYPNVLTVSFAEHQGSYLAGVMAAMASETGTIGFVGGMDIPLISKFACGYAQGAQSVDEDINVLTSMVGVTSDAWTDPVSGGNIADAQIGQGADVIFHAAGLTGEGVLRAADDAGVLGIGVDSNQNGMFPGSVLTSMLKRVDVAVYDAMQAGEDLEGGIRTLSLDDNGVGVAVDDNNQNLVTEEMMTAVDEARQAIIDGEIEVYDYAARENDPNVDDSCPALNI